jgi:hypothetical protein
LPARIASYAFAGGRKKREKEMVDVNNKNKNGDLIKQATFETKDETFYLLPKEGSRYYYLEQNLDEYGVGWVIHEENSKEISRTNIMYCVNITWLNDSPQ